MPAVITSHQSCCITGWCIVTTVLVVLGSLIPQRHLPSLNRLKIARLDCIFKMDFVLPSQVLRAPLCLAWCPAQSLPVLLHHQIWANAAAPRALGQSNIKKYPLKRKRVMNIQGQIWRGFEQPGLVWDVPLLIVCLLMDWMSLSIPSNPNLFHGSVKMMSRHLEPFFPQIKFRSNESFPGGYENTLRFQGEFNLILIWIWLTWIELKLG